jgi:hypothetical protein
MATHEGSVPAARIARAGRRWAAAHQAGRRGWVTAWARLCILEVQRAQTGWRR